MEKNTERYKDIRLCLRDDSYIMVLKDNIINLLCALNCKYEIDPLTEEIFTVYNDVKLEFVSKYNSDIKESIFEYLKTDNREDLKRKGEILCTLFKKLEAVESKLKSNNFGGIVKDTTFLFNKSGIRHWVENDKISSATFLKMSEKELEKWYDKTFNLFLTCMVLAEYIDDIQEIKNIKKSIGD